MFKRVFLRNTIIRFLHPRQFSSSSITKTIDEETVSLFRQHGAVCLRGYFSQNWIDKVQNGIHRMLEQPSQNSEKIKSKEGIYFNDYFQWRNIPEFFEYVKYSPVGVIAATLLESQVVSFYHEHVFVKESLNDSEVPFHQDQTYYPINGKQGLSIWMPVTPVEEKACLKFIKGSHNWGKLFSPRYFETWEKYDVVNDDLSQDEYHTIPEINEEHELLSWNLEPGDCLVFHMRCLHGSHDSASSQDRQTIATRWFGDDAVLARRPWITSPPIIPEDIQYGEPIRNSKFFETFSMS